MTEWTIEVVVQIPFLQAFPMEDMPAFDLVNFIGSLDGIQADDTNELLIDGIREAQPYLPCRPPLLEC